jgi:hypothetical protein
MLIKIFRRKFKKTVGVGHNEDPQEDRMVQGSRERASLLHGAGELNLHCQKNPPPNWCLEQTGAKLHEECFLS